MAEPSGVETRPQIRVTVKTPKDKEEIVICDRASVKEVVRLAREGGGREQRTERSAKGWRPRGRPGAGDEAPGRGGARGVGGSEQSDGMGGGRGRPVLTCPGSVARVGAALAELSGLGAWWGSLGKGHLVYGRRKDPGLEGSVRHGDWFQAPRHSAARASCGCAPPGASRGRGVLSSPHSSFLISNVLFSFLLYRILLSVIGAQQNNVE